MNNKFTENIGLKILSFLAAFVLWMVVVNVDDPVINRTYSGIPVEILNENVVTDEGMYYEVTGGTDSITVVISAKRSVLDDMSRDYIKATADMKMLSSANSIPIEVKITRFGDAVDSITSRTSYVQLKLEDIVERKIPLEVKSEGDVAEGYLLSSVTPKYDEVTISGPESEVMSVSKAIAIVNVDELTADESVMAPVELFDDRNVYADLDNIKLENTNVSVNVVIWGTKEIPVTCAASGTPAEGYSVIGTPSVEPGSVVITGRSAYLSSMTSLVIPPDKISISGVTDTVIQDVNIKSLLPEGIQFADEKFDGKVSVMVPIEMNDRKTVEVPVANVSIINVPEGYKATIVDIGMNLPVEVQGKGDAYDRFDGTQAIGVIDALALSPRNIADPTQPLQVGSNDARVMLTLPAGVSEVVPVYMEVIVDRVAE